MVNYMHVCMYDYRFVCLCMIICMHVCMIMGLDIYVWLYVSMYVSMYSCGFMRLRTFNDSYVRMYGFIYVLSMFIKV